ncbi:cytochrome c oxidase assembly protein [Salinicoccus sp. ID82-1]|uniref:cytochrome c oxidase assembly protein n=1 Tax=Salinicoccus sp. ID82-1 TaxID=2820269 RepID=UPI001F2AC4D8|nr:cytochrome c oxidase assembly protein [Salinicoccus sp. ID82-1]MCG1010357.1 cytochrome c oxidase assembly protein [Salinicoccus sp. ID82-1]
MMHTHMNHTGFAALEVVVAIIAATALFLYPLAMFISNGKHSKWKASRYIWWFLGIILAASALIGPLAERSHYDFNAHMAGHLLLGMLAPLLIVFSRPMTLLMRTLPNQSAKRVSRLLNSRYVTLLTRPIVAATLNIGGLYLIYMTELFTLMHMSSWLYALVHLHVFLAGYLFTISILYIDMTTHRYSFLHRGIVLILALGFHKVLSKLIYASPPEGIPETEGETGAMLMYYGGDIIDLMMIIILCYQWYRSTAPRTGKARPA